MIDHKKRTTIKAMGGAAALLAAPGIVSAGNCLHQYSPKQVSAGEEIVVPINSGAELTISLSVDPEPTIRMTNHSNKLVIVRHEYPGLIHAGEKSYDINSIFDRCAYAISPGTGRTVRIEPTVHTQPEVDFPREIYRNKPQRIVAVTGRDRNGKLANSTRSFFA